MRSGQNLGWKMKFIPPLLGSSLKASSIVFWGYQDRHIIVYAAWNTLKSTQNTLI